jgi:hypothetical protein
MKYTNILLTAIVALMLINTFNLNIIGSANAELSGMDLLGIENALSGIAASLGEIAFAITMK